MNAFKGDKQRKHSRAFCTDAFGILMKTASLNSNYVRSGGENWVHADCPDPLRVFD